MKKGLQKTERKRKTTQEYNQDVQPNSKKLDHHHIIPHDKALDLTLSTPKNPTLVTQMPPAPPATRRVRQNPTRSRAEGRAKVKEDGVPAPYPWAMDRRATVHCMEYLGNKQITTITGDVQCRKCDRIFTMEYNLVEKFQEVVMFVRNYGDMRQRAPKNWTEPNLEPCRFCGQENCCKPVIADKKRSINWLFLFLGQTIGCCTLDQLKYFCKHTKNHRTGAKDRVLFLSYMTLGRQLDKTGPFDF